MGSRISGEAGSSYPGEAVASEDAGKGHLLASRPATQLL